MVTPPPLRLVVSKSRLNEHPQLVELRGRVVVGKSTKGFLERRLFRCWWRGALQMEAELRTAMTALEQHISNLRAVAEAELVQNDDSIGDVRNRLESVISHSEAHQDGAKLMFKRLRPLV